MKKTLAVSTFVFLTAALALVGCLPAPESYALPQSGSIAETAQALQHLSNQMSAAETARAGDVATAQAHEIAVWTATAAQSTAVAAAAESTRSAQSTATMESLIIQQTATPMKQTAVAAEAEATAQYWSDYYALRDKERRDKREEMTNAMLALAPYVIGGIAFGVVVYASILVGIKYWKKPIVIDRDERGDAPIMITNYGDHIDQDRVPVGVIRVLKSGVTPQLVASESFQKQTTALDQYTDHDTRGSLEAPAAAPRVAAGRANPAQAPALPYPDIQVRRIEPGELPHKLLERPDILAQLDDDWNKDNNVVTVPYQEQPAAQKEATP